MQNEDIEIVSEIEKRNRQRIERENKLKREEEYKEASKSNTFVLFNSVISTLTVICSALFCLFFLWANSKPLFAVVVLMIALSFLFRFLAKHFYFAGNRKKFETFNKMAGIAGVATSMFELADVRSGKSSGALNKADNVANSLRSTYVTISEQQYTGGAYADPKYDVIRNQAFGTGRYLSTKLSEFHVTRVLDGVKRKAINLPSKHKVQIGLMCMYVTDVLSGDYKEEEKLYYSIVGALQYFVYPMSNIPDNLPLIGYQDDMFVTFCVLAEFRESLDKYESWKIASTKIALERSCEKDHALIWEKLADSGYTVMLRSDKLNILENSLESIDSLQEPEKAYALKVYNLCTDYINGVYTKIPVKILNGMVGMLGYCALKKDLIEDNITVLGYIDDTVIVKCCIKFTETEVAEYELWTSLNALLDENDELVEYLNRVIGSDAKLRDCEINRLSSLCTDDSIEDRSQRARYTIKQIL